MLRDFVVCCNESIVDSIDQVTMYLIQICQSPLADTTVVHEIVQGFISVIGKGRTLRFGREAWEGNRSF